MVVVGLKINGLLVVFGGIIGVVIELIEVGEKIEGFGVGRGESDGLF